MKTRGMAVAGLSLVAALTFMAGCNTADKGGDGTSATNPTKAADPAAQLAEAGEKLADETFKVKLDMGTSGSMSGVVDGPKKSADLSMEMSEEGMSIKMNMRMIKTDMYMKMDLGGIELPGLDPKKWIHIDMTTLPDDNGLGINTDSYDPATAAEFLKAATSVEKVDDRTFKGMIDLSKATGATGIEEADVAKLDAATKKVPFEATLDDQGRLAGLTINLPKLGSEPAMKMVATYSDFGTKVNVAKPAAKDITDTPPSFLDELTK